MCFCKNSTLPAPFGCQFVPYANGGHCIPVARVIARITDPNRCCNEYDSVEIECPKCGERHYHGWGAGPRTPHCRPEHRTPGDYYIPEAPDVPIQYRQ